MPINPGYRFMNEQADLGGGAFNAGMGLWGGPQPERATPYIPSGITPDVRQAVQMGRAQQQQPQQPIAPVAPIARQPMQAPQMPVQTQMTEQDLPSELPQPEVEQQSLGYGNIEDIPTNEGLDNTPQSANHNYKQSQELQRFEQTQLAKRGSDMGMDPRQLYVALAQFSAGMGNIKGKDTHSTAGDFYNMQKGYEAQDEARKMRQEEFAARMAPKPVDPLDIEQKKAMIEYLKRKGMPQPAAPIDPVKQKWMEAQTRNLDARTKNEMLGSQRPVVTKDGKPQTEMLNPKQIKTATDLRKEYQNHPVTKTSNDLNAMWGKVREVMDNPSAAGDMASIFMFMKALDPGSTVREGEYKSAAEATSALGRVQQSLQKAGTGQNLTPEQRADFKSIMEKFYRAQMKSQKRVDDQYKGLAGRTGVDPQDLLINESSQPSTIKSVNDLPDVR